MTMDKYTHSHRDRTAVDSTGVAVALLIIPRCMPKTHTDASSDATTTTTPTTRDVAPILKQ